MRLPNLKIIFTVCFYTREINLLLKLPLFIRFVYTACFQVLLEFLDEALKQIPDVLLIGGKM